MKKVFWWKKIKSSPQIKSADSSVGRAEDCRKTYILRSLVRVWVCGSNQTLFDNSCRKLLTLQNRKKGEKILNQNQQKTSILNFTQHIKVFSLSFAENQNIHRKTKKNTLFWASRQKRNKKSPVKTKLEQLSASNCWYALVRSAEDCINCYLRIEGSKRFR